MQDPRPRGRDVPSVGSIQEVTHHANEADHRIDRSRMHHREPRRARRADRVARRRDRDRRGPPHRLWCDRDVFARGRPLAAPVGCDRRGSPSCDARRCVAAAGRSLHDARDHGRRVARGRLPVVAADRVRTGRLVQLRLDRQRRQAEYREDRSGATRLGGGRPHRDAAGLRTRRQRDRAQPSHRERRQNRLLVPAGRTHARGSDTVDQPVEAGLAEVCGHLRMDGAGGSGGVPDGAEDAPKDPETRKEARSHAEVAHPGWERTR